MEELILQMFNVIQAFKMIYINHLFIQKKLTTLKFIEYNSFLFFFFFFQNKKKKKTRLHNNKLIIQYFFFKKKIPLNKFIQTHHGYVQINQMPMNTREFLTLGFVLADKKDGDFQLDIEWIKVSNLDLDVNSEEDRKQKESN